MSKHATAGTSRQGRAHRVERRQRLGLVERRQVGELAQPGDDAVVDDHRRAEGRAAVDDAVPDRVHGA